MATLNIGGRPSTGGIKQAASGDTVAVGAGVTLEATSGEVKLPLQPYINNVQCSANVTADNLDTLTAGATSNAEDLHVHLPSKTLAAMTSTNQMVARLSTGLTVHDGTEASAKALLGGGMCVAGGMAAASIAYYPVGSLAPVGATGWAQNVPLYPNGAGGMVPWGDASLSGTFSRECGVYDGQFFAVAFGPVEAF